MNQFYLFMALGSLLACGEKPEGNTGPCGGFAGCPPNIEVNATDENGEYVAADQVYWYFAPDSPEYDGEHDLSCQTSSCMSWALENAPGPFFYVAGNREGPEHIDPACAYDGYDGQPVEFNGTALTITLDLSLHESCE